MFGQPEWFAKKTSGKGLRPISWRGWAYSAAWLAAIAIPFMALVIAHKPIESLVWGVFACLALTWDVRKITQAMDTPVATPADEPFVIDENETASAEFATRGYKLRIR